MDVDPWTDLVQQVLVVQQEEELEQEETFTDKEQEPVDKEDMAEEWGDQVKVDTTSEIVWIIKNKIKIPFNCSFVNKFLYSFNG